MSLSGFQRRRREQAAKEAAQVQQAPKKAIDYAEMTKAQLIDYAAKENIGLGKAKTNAEIIAIIEKHEKG